MSEQQRITQKTMMHTQSSKRFRRLRRSCFGNRPTVTPKKRKYRHRALAMMNLGFFGGCKILAEDVHDGPHEPEAIAAGWGVIWSGSISGVDGIDEIHDIRMGYRRMIEIMGHSAA